VTSLTFYGGVDEIGGNKILLEDTDTKVFFDFGQSFTMGEAYFMDWLSPRRVNGIGDYLEFNLLPRVKGLYSEEMLHGTDMPYEPPCFDAVFLSHAHFDHVGHICFLDPEIPVFLGEGTKLFLEAMEKTSRTSYGDHDYRCFRTGDKIKVGCIEVEPIHVDHSIPAAYGFIIHTSSGAIVYTGDFRNHGPRRDLTWDFLNRMEESSPIAHITEGTRMVEEEKRRNYSENQVKTLSNQIVSGTNSLVLVTHYSRDMDRLRTFYRVAQENDRILVITPRIAYLLDLLLEDPRLDLPDPMNDETIKVYFKRKKSGKLRETDYYIWERRYLDNSVEHGYVHENQENVLMNLGFFQFCELIDIKPEQGTHFIHSQSEYRTEEDLQEEIMNNWIDHFKLKFHQLHASGHVNRLELTEIINRIKPGKIYPVHTENQHLFKSLETPVQIIKKGIKHEIR
jgi:ribonuclease J